MINNIKKLQDAQDLHYQDSFARVFQQLVRGDGFVLSSYPPPHPLLEHSRPPKGTIWCCQMLWSTMKLYFCTSHKSVGRNHKEMTSLLPNQQSIVDHCIIRKMSLENRYLSLLQVFLLLIYIRIASFQEQIHYLSYFYFRNTYIKDKCLYLYA